VAVEQTPAGAWRGPATNPSIEKSHIDFAPPDQM
jgi:hypothetical protein